MRKILRYFSNYKLRSVLSPLFKLSEATFELIVPLVIADIIDKGIVSSDISYINRRVILLLIFAVVGFVSAILAQYFAATAAAGISSDIRRDLFNKIENLSITSYERLGSAKIVTGLTSDVNQIQSGINLFLRLLLRSPFIVLGAVIMAFTISPGMALISVIAVLILGIVVALNMKLAIPSYQKTRDGLDTLAGHANNGLSGVRVIRGFNRTFDDYNSFVEESSYLNRMQKAAAKISSYLNPLTFFIINTAVCILIYRGGVNVSIGSLTQGEVVALYNYMSQILVELIKLANLIISVSRAIACAGRVGKILELPDDTNGGALVFDDPSKAHSIEFKDVSFRYDGSSEDSLSDISFVVKPGEKVGIIGKTGSGKSTVAQLASGLYPVSSGKILIDDRPIEEYSRKSFPRGVGLCLQKALMFSGTIAYNIHLGRKNIDADALAYAVNMSCTDDVINSKKEGMEYKVEANGTGLSGGQKQRIGIARTLAGRPGILILDDSTSALDAGTENRLLNNINSLSNSPTVLIVSQKVRTVRGCDRIILMDEGKIVAYGSHEELKRTSQDYNELLRLQREEELL
ncbi:MAG: ABC transporter ATP-binding protein [Clostridiales bacterium]|nr:ABC transporter ATP-binding protein [Clostridiales bacterium]